MAKMKSKNGVESVSFLGVAYYASSEGVFEVPEVAVNDLMSHGFEIVEETAPAAEATTDGGTQSTADSSGGKVVMPLADALAQLDPANDEHWTQVGKPKMGAINEISGGKYKLDDVNAIAPDLTREAAAAAKAAAAEGQGTEGTADGNGEGSTGNESAETLNPDAAA